MLINFDNLDEKITENFKGGEGRLSQIGIDDGACKVMKCMLEPGSSVGLHTHQGNSEVVFPISGSAVCIGDGVEEQLVPGVASYCAEGHSHTLINNGTENFVFYAVVPEHHL